MSILEVFATLTGLIYLILLIKENIWCWLFGAISSALSVVLFYQSQLYSEAILYFFYVLAAGYGYFIWSRKTVNAQSIQVRNIVMSAKALVIVVGVLIGILLGYIMKRWTDADLPFIDAQTTSFSFIATFLEAHKVIFGWIIWIMVNGASIALYGYKGLYLYAGLMVVYFVLSIYGWLDWSKKHKMILSN